MGYRELTLKLPTDYTDQELTAAIGRQLNIQDFSWQMETKSLDARKKSSIHWQVRIGVVSDELKGGDPPAVPELAIPRIKTNARAIVVGSGPAGFFAALVLTKAGFRTTIIERGSKVRKRADSIREFEASGRFDPSGNYAFGEGGAGTFSDGKLTSRTKNVPREKQFILSSYVRSGAPREIEYLAHPHLGTDNLRQIVRNLRSEFETLGGEIRFETMLEDLTIRNGTVTSVLTSRGEFPAETVVLAPGHSAHETFRMLMRNGILFRTKPFAIGCRVEHPQELINTAQWGRASLPGVKAAEYRLTSRGDNLLPVYTFCMCPGGTVVPATANETSNIVNGMSRYRRNGEFANAACVAAVNLETLTGRPMSPEEALDWLGDLEHHFFQRSPGYQAPFCSIREFIDRKTPSRPSASSYPLGLDPQPLWALLPDTISRSIARGLQAFQKKLRGFETGNILGLESKTSSPIQAIREPGGLCAGFSNLYLAGEGSGWSGGIISSGVDGIKTAMNIIQLNS